MALSVSLIQTRPDCDKILSDLTDQENTLSFNQLRIRRAKDAAIKRATALDADLAATQAEIDSLRAMIAALPKVPTKDQMIDSFEITNGVAGINDISPNLCYVGDLDSSHKMRLDSCTAEQTSTMLDFIHDA